MLPYCRGWTLSHSIQWVLNSYNFIIHKCRFLQRFLVLELSGEMNCYCTNPSVKLQSREDSWLSTLYLTLPTYIYTAAHTDSSAAHSWSTAGHWAVTLSWLRNKHFRHNDRSYWGRAEPSSYTSLCRVLLLVWSHKMTVVTSISSFFLKLCLTQGAMTQIHKHMEIRS